MANGLPAFEIPQPVLGQSAVPLGRLDEFEVPAEEELPVIAMPDDIATIGAPPVDVEVPAPAAQPSGVVDDFEVGPVADPAEIAFEAQPASPRAELAAGVSPEFVEQQFTVQTLSDQQDQLWKRSQELAFSLGSEKDPAKRAEREKQAQDNIAATQANQQQLRLARGMAQRTQAVETARLGDAMAAQQRRLAIDVEESALASEREQQIDDADRLRNQQAAQADVSAARERRAQIIERGPSKPAFARTAMAMITEALKPIARPDGTADYGAVVDRLMRETKEQHAREDAAAQLRVQIAGDEVGNIGRARKEEALQSAVVRELTARSLRIEVETAAANTKDEFAQARALTIGDDLKRHEAAAQATQRALAEDKAHKLAMDDAKRRKVEAEIALTGAKVGTEGQRALKLSAEAAKAARGKGGKKRADALTTQAQLRGLDKKTALDIEQRGIRGAGGLFLQNPDKSYAMAKNAKIATALDATHVELQNVNDLLNELHAIRTEYGQEFKQGNSEAHQRMVGAMNQVKLALKNVYELGILSESDEKILDGITGGDPSGWYDKRPSWLAIRERAEKAFGRSLRQKAGYQGTFKLQAPAEYTPPTRKEAVTKYRNAYHAGSGTVLPAKDRMESFDAAQSATEAERDTKVGAYSQAHAEAHSYIKTVGPKNLIDMHKQWQKAVKAGDDAKAERIDDAIDSEEEFQFLLKQKRTRLRDAMEDVEDVNKAEEETRTTVEEQRSERRRGGGRSAF